MTGASLGYSGYYGSTTLNNVGTRGYWWVSTIRGTNGAYSLLMYSDNTIYPQGNSDKYVGRAVRCVSNLAYQSGNTTQSEPDALTIGACLN